MGPSKNCKCPKTFSYFLHIKVHITPYISYFVYLSAYSHTLNRSKKIKDASLRPRWSWPSISHYFCIFFLISVWLYLWEKKQSLGQIEEAMSVQAAPVATPYPARHMTSRDLPGRTCTNGWTKTTNYTFCFHLCQRKVARFQITRWIRSSCFKLLPPPLL